MKYFKSALASLLIIFSSVTEAAFVFFSVRTAWENEVVNRGQSFIQGEI